MDPGLEVIIFMGVILKIPVAFACWLIYYAVRSEPEIEDAPNDGEHRFRRYRREPKRPRDPRRGPGSGRSLPLPCPEQGSLRVRGASPASKPLTASARRPGH